VPKHRARAAEPNARTPSHQRRPSLEASEAGTTTAATRPTWPGIRYVQYARHTLHYTPPSFLPPDFAVFCTALFVYICSSAGRWIDDIHICMHTAYTRDKTTTWTWTSYDACCMFVQTPNETISDVPL
jgi:hypothetical protein